MRIINNTVYYTSGDVAALCGKKSLQTVNLWEKYSKEQEQRGEKRLIPAPALILNNRKLYTKEQVREIRQVSEQLIKGLLRGEMAEFNRKRMGTRGQEIQARMDAKNGMRLN